MSAFEEYNALELKRERELESSKDLSNYVIKQKSIQLYPHSSQPLFGFTLQELNLLAFLFELIQDTAQQTLGWNVCQTNLQISPTRLNWAARWKFSYITSKCTGLVESYGCTLFLLHFPAWHVQIMPTSSQPWCWCLTRSVQRKEAQVIMFRQLQQRLGKQIENWPELLMKSAFRWTTDELWKSKKQKWHSVMLYSCSSKIYAGRNDSAAQKSWHSQLKPSIKT